MVRLRDIAERAGTSVGTVSVVLNGRASNVRISDRTRQAVLAAAHDLGYSPEVAARRLRTNGSDRRALVLAVAHPSDSRLSLASRVISGMQRHLATVRDELAALAYDAQVTLETFVPGQLHRLRGLTEPLWFNGLLVTNTAPEDDAFLDQLATRDSHHCGVPLVVFQRHSAQSCVNADNRAAAAEVAEHLLALGHRRFLVLTPDISAEVHGLRVAGFTERVEGRGIGTVEHVRAPGFSWTEDAYETMTRLLRRQPTARPTAVFATNDLLALGVIRAAVDCGLWVPEDLAVVGFDDAEFAPFTVPSLTTVHLPVEEMAAAGTAMLLDLIQHKVEAPVQRMLPTRLVVRESCGAALPAAPSRLISTAT